MTPVLVHFHFPFAGPWGSELASACAPLAHDIAAERHLAWKIWTEDQANGQAGGLYLFDDEAAARLYADKHARRMGLSEDAVRFLPINQTLSRLTRAPLPLPARLTPAPREFALSV